MTQARIVTALGLAAAIVAAPSLVAAQARSRPATATGRAVARPAGRPARPTVVTAAPYRPYYSPYRYYPYRPPIGLGLGFGYGYPGYFNSYPYGYRYGYRGYGYPAYGYPAYRYPAYGYRGYGYPGYGGRPYGGVRIDLPQRDAEVYVDRYYMGIVDDFDGVLQQLNLEAGPHHVEIRARGFEPIAFDVNVEPGRTITYRSALRPVQP